MKSNTLPIYKKWLATATPEQIELVDSIYAECEAHYGAGGDNVVECFEPQEVLEDLKTIEGARKYCGLKVNQAADARWGEDTDPELERMKDFDKWEKDGAKGSAGV